MIIDYRIYCTIYAVCSVVYLSSFLFVGNQRLRNLTFGGGLLSALALAFINYLDWLWS